MAASDIAKKPLIRISKKMIRIRIPISIKNIYL
jgi:hypothetical protein